MSVLSTGKSSSLLRDGDLRNLVANAKVNFSTILQNNNQSFDISPIILSYVCPNFCSGPGIVGVHFSDDCFTTNPGRTEPILSTMCLFPLAVVNATGSNFWGPFWSDPFFDCLSTLRCRLYRSIPFQNMTFYT